MIPLRKELFSTHATKIYPYFTEFEYEFLPKIHLTEKN